MFELARIMESRSTVNAIAGDIISSMNGMKLKKIFIIFLLQGNIIDKRYILSRGEIVSLHIYIQHES